MTLDAQCPRPIAAVELPSIGQIRVGFSANFEAVEVTYRATDEGGHVYMVTETHAFAVPGFTVDVAAEFFGCD